MNDTSRLLTILASAVVAILFSVYSGCTKNDIVLPPASPDSTFGIFSPFWSHDGTKILALGQVFGLPGYDFYELDPTGGGATLLMRDSLTKDYPVLSPDGTKIAYLAAEYGSLLCCAHVWVMNVDGTSARDLTPFFSNWEYLRWSPDSRYLTFDGGVEDSGVINYQIVKADVRSGQLMQLTRGDYGNRDASFFPSGQEIAYLSGRIHTDYGGKVWVMNADGSDPRPIDTTRTASTYPRPSPVGNDLYFYWGLGNESDAGLYSVDLDSTTLPASQSAFRFFNRDNYLNRAQWSPDGSYLLSLRAYSNLSEDLVLLNKNGELHRRITQNFSVSLLTYAWSPDGLYLVFDAIDEQSKSMGMFIYDLITNRLTRLTYRRK